MDDRVQEYLETFLSDLPDMRRPRVADEWLVTFLMYALRDSFRVRFSCDGIDPGKLIAPSPCYSGPNGQRCTTHRSCLVLDRMGVSIHDEELIEQFRFTLGLLASDGAALMID